MTEQYGADGARHEGHPESRHGSQQGRTGITRREEEQGENRDGSRGVDVKIEKFDSRPGEAGNDDAFPVDSVFR